VFTATKRAGQRRNTESATHNTHHTTQYTTHNTTQHTTPHHTTLHTTQYKRSLGTYIQNDFSRPCWSASFICFWFRVSFNNFLLRICVRMCVCIVCACVCACVCGCARVGACVYVCPVLLCVCVAVYSSSRITPTRCESMHPCRKAHLLWSVSWIKCSQLENYIHKRKTDTPNHARTNPDL